LRKPDEQLQRLAVSPPGDEQQQQLDRDHRPRWQRCYHQKVQ
jgi:hypothetical protein